ncbi:MAG: hypothetical protein EPO06_03620 [Burkholderiaceae bacterium]|nr:MAG: hypothetical protein EPO06_03620 [Burkholderiaceae bacterium]
MFATHDTQALRQKLMVVFLILFCQTQNVSGQTGDPPTPEAAAATLRAQHTALREQLAHNPFQQPLHLDSSDADGVLRGDIHAVLEAPFATVRTALSDPSQWCDILMLHLNIKYCRATLNQSQQRLKVYIGRKFEQPLDDATPVDFIYQTTADAADYMQTSLHAASGPMGTSNYRIAVEAIPLDPAHTFLHFSFSHAYGFAARTAMRIYLKTLASAKVGFTIAGTDSDGQPIHIGDVRGMVERNAMRYYLAIDTYLKFPNTPADPPRDPFREERLQHWFLATERYPLQLHEVTQNEYLAMKRKEYQRIAAAPKE